MKIKVLIFWLLSLSSGLYPPPMMRKSRFLFAKFRIFDRKSGGIIPKSHPHHKLYLSCHSYTRILYPHKACPQGASGPSHPDNQSSTIPNHLDPLCGKQKTSCLGVFVANSFPEPRARPALHRRRNLPPPKVLHPKMTRRHPDKLLKRPRKIALIVIPHLKTYLRAVLLRR